MNRHDMKQLLCHVVEAYVDEVFHEEDRSTIEHLGPQSRVSDFALWLRTHDIEQMSDLIERFQSLDGQDNQELHVMLRNDEIDMIKTATGFYLDACEQAKRHTDPETESYDMAGIYRDEATCNSVLERIRNQIELDNEVN